MPVRHDPHGPAPHGGPGRAGVRVRAGGSDPVPGAPLDRRGDVRLPLAVGLAALAAVAYLGATDPYRPGPHLACPVLALTGLYCAGCGGQRAVHDLAHGDVVGAWAMNPLVVLSAPVAVAGWLSWLARRRRGVRAVPVLGRPTAALPWLVAVVVVAFAVLRNLPALAPWLAP